MGIREEQETKRQKKQAALAEKLVPPFFG